MSDFAPYTGFGDDPNSSARFTILLDSDGRLPDWTGGPRLVQRTVPGSSRVNIRRMGRDPYTVEFRLEFDDLQHLDALDAMQGQVSTLRYPYGVTRTVGGHYELIVNRPYLVIPEVRLLSLADIVVDVETAEATATFLKPFGEVA